MSDDVTSRLDHTAADCEPPFMESCPKMVRCPVFPEFKSRSALRVMQTLYCESEFSRCARFIMVTSGTMPPNTLLPDGTTLPASSARKPNE